MEVKQDQDQRQGSYSCSSISSNEAHGRPAKQSAQTAQKPTRDQNNKQKKRMAIRARAVRAKVLNVHRQVWQTRHSGGVWGSGAATVEVGSGEDVTHNDLSNANNEGTGVSTAIIHASKHRARSLRGFDPPAVVCKAAQRSGRSASPTAAPPEPAHAF